MIHIKLLDPFDTRLFMINENFQVDTAKQIQVYLVTIVPDGHYERPVLVKKANLFRQGKPVEISPRYHHNLNL
jgi:hypothetical protein